MILVDTSVWIDYLRGDRNNGTQILHQALDSGIDCGVCSLIYQEVLQGAKTSREFNSLMEYLDTQRFYELRDPKESFVQAARIYFNCRRRGITVSSSADCLIAQLAIENNLLLLHNDSDYERIAEVVNLRFYTG